MASIAESPPVAADEQFLATLAHEICNAVGPIRTGIDLLQTEGIDEATSRWAQGVMRRQIAQLVWMAQGLREVSRLRRGMIRLQKEPALLEALVRSGVAMAQPLMDGHEHALIVEIEDDRAVIEADRRRMAEVVAHLLYNAARFSVRPGRIWISTASDGADALVRVRDEGIGIEAAMLPQIFDLFAPAGPAPLAGASAEPRYGGLGTGLTLVRGLVEMHGGTVEASSPGRDQGSEFRVRLPRLPQPGSENAV